MICSIDPKMSFDHQRISADEMVNQFSDYDVISFDVFGTLILDPFLSLLCKMGVMAHIAFS